MAYSWVILTIQNCLKVTHFLRSEVQENPYIMTDRNKDAKYDSVASVGTTLIPLWHLLRLFFVATLQLIFSLHPILLPSLLHRLHSPKWSPVTFPHLHFCFITHFPGNSTSDRIFPWFGYIYKVINELILPTLSYGLYKVNRNVVFFSKNV